jgi:hypothetical protein
MTVFAHNQIMPILLVIVLAVIAMMWVTNTSLRGQSKNPVSMISPTSQEQNRIVEKSSCYRYLRNARAFLTKVDTGFVNKKCYNKGIERGFDSIKT